MAEPDSDVELWVDVEIRPGTQSGTEQVLRGRGVPHLRSQVRGDLVVTIDVETPGRLDERQEELLRELAELRHEESPDGRIQTAAQGGLRPAAGRLQVSLPVFLGPVTDVAVGRRGAARG